MWAERQERSRSLALLQPELLYNLIMTRVRLLQSVMAACVLCLLPFSGAEPQVTKVDVALALAIDVSYSVDSFEHRLQMEGFAAALESPEIIDAIQKGKHQRIAITVYQWSDERNQSVLIPWTIISTEADAKRIATILAVGRRDVSEGGTAISASLLFGSHLFDTAPAAERRVIDLATDGRNNIGRPVYEARDAVVAQGITINGLAISNEWQQLATYLERQVVGGSLAFVEEASTYDDFGAAMLRKLLREISGPGIT
jgi:Protein of unknown function (DUF1194)